MCFASWSLWKWRQCISNPCFFCNDSGIAYRALLDIKKDEFGWVRETICPHCLDRRKKHDRLTVLTVMLSKKILRRISVS